MYNLDLLKPLIEEAINSSQSMREAASKTQLHFNTFKKYALILGLYNPNPAGKGIKKKMPSIPIEEILSGKHNGYHTFKLAKRLLKEGIKEHKCENCEITEWNNLPVPLELDHIDGNSYNHQKDNLRFLCPNCHAQTSTHRGRNKCR